METNTNTKKQTKIEQQVRAFCAEHELEIWDSGETYTIFIAEDHEFCITYHDGWERYKQSWVTRQWHDAYQHLTSYIK